MKSTHALTLAETMVATAAASLLILGLFTAILSLQRSFGSTDLRAKTEADRMRLYDYLSLDLRRALRVELNEGVLTVDIPDFYESNNPADAGYRQGRVPRISGGVVGYGEEVIHVVYRQENTGIVRVENGVPMEIVRDVAGFEPTLESLGSVVSHRVSFEPGNTGLYSPGNQLFSGKIRLRNQRRE